MGSAATVNSSIVSREGLLTSIKTTSGLIALMRAAKVARCVRTSIIPRPAEESASTICCALSESCSTITIESAFFMHFGFHRVRQKARISVPLFAQSGLLPKLLAKLAACRPLLVQRLCQIRSFEIWEEEYQCSYEGGNGAKAAGYLVALSPIISAT